MSDGAVFLSYASQDAEAARRIRDALQAQGLEVWFDQSELRGGDAWDASIRRQIKECTLFVPIVSATTQGRTEGYFRLEWRLAEQRSHLMAKGRPFIVPVVIDDTPDAGAHVPDAFLEVQWSRMPEGRCDEAFAARLKQLLSGEIPRSTGTSAAAQSAPAPSKGPSRRTVAIIAIVALVSLVPVAGGLLVAWVGKSDPAKRPAVSAPTPGSAAERIAKARELLDDDPLITRRNVELAEQLALEAIAKDPSGAEAFAAAAWVNYRYIQSNYEDTPQRRADLRSQAEKAKLLDPESASAELAVCALLMLNRDWSEASRRLEKLAERAPKNLTVLREAAFAAGRTGTDAAATATAASSLERLRAHSPLGRSYADTDRAGAHWRRGEYVEADRLLDGVFAAGQPVRQSYLLRVLVVLYGWGDLAAARAFVASMPSKLLLEDVFIAHVTTLWMFSGDYDKALETLGRSQRDVLQEALVEQPIALLRGDAHAAAGRPAAAVLQWQEALRTVDRLLATKPDSVRLNEQKAIILALLGHRKEAAVAYDLARELKKNPPAGSVEWARSYEYHRAAGDDEGAIVRMDRLMTRDYGRWPFVYNQLRYDGSFRHLHRDPRAKAMLERGARWLAEKKASGNP